MRVTNDFNAEAMDSLLNEFTKSIRANYEYTNTEIIYACLNTIASVLVNIECPDCRKQMGVVICTGPLPNNA
jgi:hypothetical protein